MSLQYPIVPSLYFFDPHFDQFPEEQEPYGNEPREKFNQEKEKKALVH